MPPVNGVRRVGFAGLMASVACILLSITPGSAQSPEEHASHHPGAAPIAGTMPAGEPGATAGMPAAGGGGMMEQMGEMMKNMGKPPPKQLYPTLMALPELTPEKRTEVEHAADERMHGGTMLMGQALDTLNAGIQSGDYAAMQEATTRLREGLAQLESGVAARRALAEGRAPRDLALAWFKQEMRLTAPVSSDELPGSRGLSILHLSTMALLVVFAFAMFAMYFFKMRRAAALFRRIEPDKASPPPGSAPPLDGKAGSPGAKPPNAGGSPPAKPGTDAVEDDKASSPAPGEKPPGSTPTSTA